MQKRRCPVLPLLLIGCLSVASLAAAEPAPRGQPWPRHAIDDSAPGADGVRLADVNGDGHPDVVTGFEEGGVTRVFLHPGPAAVRQPWPAVTVGRTPSVEDAVFADLDGDGRTDVVSSCEGGTKTMFIHWAPKETEKETGPVCRNGPEGASHKRVLSPFPGADYLTASAWRAEPIPASQGRQQWMFCLPMQVDGRGGLDLVAGGKGAGASIGWFQSPENPRDVQKWQWHPISPAGWIMSLRSVDMDGDGDPDVLASDRKGTWRGCRWLENPGPGPAQTGTWENHFLGGRQREVMFLNVCDLDADGNAEIVCATRGGGILFLHRLVARAPEWATGEFPMPNNVGTGKGVAVGDVDRDGRPDLVFSCENASGSRSGVTWMSCDGAPGKDLWTAHEISGPEGIKFDRLELVDLDGDGDLDVMTCEESQATGGRRWGLGVIWYENPLPPRSPKP